MIYLDPKSDALENIKLMAQGAGAYTTQAEFEARNRMNEGYEYKRILSLTASVSAVALGIILAVTIQPVLLVASLIAIAPLGYMLALRANHNELAAKHLEQKTIVLSIIRDVATHIENVRTFKINKLLDSRIFDYDKLRQKEVEIDTEIKLPEFVQLALKAQKTLALHYSRAVLESFDRHVTNLTSSNKKVPVIYINSCPLALEVRIAMTHATSVIFDKQHAQLW